MKKDILEKAVKSRQSPPEPIIQEEVKEDTKMPMPNEFILNPLLSIHTMTDDLALEVDDLKKITLQNQKILEAILDRNSKILDIQLQEADEGGVFRKRGSAPTSKFFYVNAFNEIGHFAKGYTVKNDGPNTIFVAHNAPFNPEVDVDPTDITSQQSRFEEVLNGEPLRFSFNRRKIESVHVISDPSSGKGSSNVRIWLVW